MARGNKSRWRNPLVRTEPGYQVCKVIGIFLPSRSLSISVSIDSIIQLWPGIPLSNAKLAVRPPAQLGLSIARISGGTPCILSCFPTEKPPATSRRICFSLASDLGDAPYLRSFPVFKHLLVDDDVRKGTPWISSAPTPHRSDAVGPGFLARKWKSAM